MPMSRLTWKVLSIHNDNQLPGPRHMTRNFRNKGKKAKSNLQILRPEKSQLWSFLGLCNIFRRFMPKVLRSTAPLSNRLQNCQPSTFPELAAEEKWSVEDFIKALTSPMVLKLPREIGYYTPDTDAWNAKNGCCYCDKNHTDLINQLFIEPELRKSARENR